MENKSESWTKFEIVTVIVNFMAALQSILLFYYSFTSSLELSFKATVALLSTLNFALIIITYKTILNHHKDNKRNAVLQITNKRQEDLISTLESLLEESKDVHKKAAIIIHNICHENRLILYYLLYETAEADEIKLLSIKSSFKKYFLYLLANIKELFDIITKDDCSSCIKIITPDGDVKTFMRDPVSYRARHETDKQLPLFKKEGNTAFSLISSTDFSDSYFVSDNLNDYDNYLNTNAKWRNFYNASIVTPIRISLKSTDDGEEESYILGFICVDNKKGGFNNEICINTLSAVGDLCFHLFNIYDNLEDIADEATQ